MKVVKTDLSAANTNCSCLDNLTSSCGTVLNMINTFNTESVTELKGIGYNMVRLKLSVYSQALDSLGKILTNIPSNLQNVNNKMINFMEGFSYIDTSELSELKAELAELKEKIDTYESQGGDASSYRADYNRLNKYATKMEGLRSADSSYYGELANLISDIESICTKIASINPDFTSKTVFNNVSNVELFNVANIDNYDTTGFSEEAKDILEEIIQTWPDDIDEQRVTAILKALSLHGQGIEYSGKLRDIALDHLNEIPEGLDCSSFVTYCYRNAGISVAGKGTTAYFHSDANYSTISESELQPGDIALLYKKYVDGDHVAMYIGTNSAGKKIFIECTSNKKIGPGIAFSTEDDRSWAIYRTYNKYSSSNSEKI